MSKIAGLRAAHELLTVYRNATARHHLLGYPAHPSEKPYDTRLVESSFLLVEIEDIIQNLEAIAEVCQHVLAGTVPMENYLDPSTFNPWASVIEVLDNEFLMPVDKLSPRLAEWLDAQPEQSRAITAKLQQILPPLWVPDENGRLRPPTEEERERAPEADMMRSMEQNFFAMTYAANLAEVRALAESRGDISRIVALVA